MKQAKNAFGSILGLIIAVAVAFGAGYYVSESSTPDPITQVHDIENITEGMPEEVDFSQFWSTWNIINDRYVPTLGTSTEAVTTQEKVWGAINGLAGSLDDPYTVFFPPEDLEIFQADISGNFEGVGMEVALRDGRITVVAPLPNTPAERSGIRAGDVVIDIDGTSTAGMSIDAGVRLIRGERGTVVTLMVAREGEDELLEIPITRDVIEIPTISTSAVRKTQTSTTNTEGEGSGVEKIATEEPEADPALRDDGIYVIELYNFGATSPDLFRQAMINFEVSGADKLILDLRGNPGGFLEAAVDIASYFLPEGKLVVSEVVGAEKMERAHRSTGHSLLSSVPEMVILVDRGSASASEIVAGALKEHGVATLIGERTFGKGSVQELVPIDQTTSIKVTIARWLTPDGVSLSQTGLEPDIEIKLSNEDILAERDLQLGKAVDILLSNE